MQKQLMTSLIAIALMVCVVGCGGPKKPDDLPQLHAVSATVTLDGQPYEGASVMLAPEDGGQWAANGTTDANGVCTFMTKGTYEGVAAGKYRVAVKKMSVPPELPELEGLEGDARMAKLQELEAAGKIEAPKLLSPEKYSLAGKSGLTADITGPTTDLKFELTK